ncbi:hypothetical protein CJ030_MR2G000640 [Morella rubra]|uniref:Uncharacterized protein n=1 Tax=Morella rubra TaxID=262757 RepID=A0A6A1WFA4_9ROSI|nr:hypothetical protein CJ030_MR2G000640 [Morella rubra]
MVKALKLLTKRATTSVSVQSTLAANQEFFKLDLMKLVVDVSLIRKNLKIANRDEDSSTVSPQEDPMVVEQDADSVATTADVEEKG